MPPHITTEVEQSDPVVQPAYVDGIEWTPPEWTLCGFPIDRGHPDWICLDAAVRTLHQLADTVTEIDSTALGPAMHVAHMLVSRQSADGRWPAALYARTGGARGDGRSDAPIHLYRKLRELLQTTEFDHVIAFAEKQSTRCGRP